MDSVQIIPVILVPQCKNKNFKIINNFKDLENVDDIRKQFIKLKYLLFSKKDRTFKGISSACR